MLEIPPTQMPSKIPDPEFDSSARNFFRIMNGNQYTYIFLVALGILIYQIVEIDYNIELITEAWTTNYNTVLERILTAILVTLGELIPLAVTLIVLFKSLQFWKDLKHGRSH